MCEFSGQVVLMQNISFWGQICFKLPQNQRSLGSDTLSLIVLGAVDIWLLFFYQEKHTILFITVKTKNVIGQAGLF